MLRIVPHIVPRVGRSNEHFPDGFELHLLNLLPKLKRLGEVLFCERQRLGGLVQCAGFSIQVQGLGSRVQGSGIRVQVFGVQGSGFGAQGSWFDPASVEEG